ncbi:biopolymer transporter ExbD, partial [Bacteroidales bacterium OttesenSCG-928-J19]|nr:biopolymer transporter ExbD [Bacteroidales bacterium OttesenSCG-928-J19]
MRRKRKIPQINSSASADIAFLLLIFFLITSSLDPRTGFYQKLETKKNEAVLS